MSRLTETPRVPAASPYDGGQETQREGNRDNAKSKKAQTVRYSVLASIASVFAVKAYLFISGLIDPIVGLYELIVISNVFIPFYIAYTRYKDPSTSSPDSAVDRGGNFPYKDGGNNILQPLVSVVIPVFNESKLLRQVVDACLKSSYSKIEIILIDDGSTDGSGKMMDFICGENHDRVKVIHLEENSGKRRAVREGIIRGDARGEVIVFIDSDSVVDRYAIEKLVHGFSDPDVGAVAGHGRVLNVDENTLTKMQDTWYDGQFSVMKGMESAFGSVTCCSGILSAYRREAIMSCLDDWCNEKFLGAPFDSGDDRQLTSFVLGGSNHYLGKGEKVWRIKYCESAVVNTEVPSSFNKFAKQQIRWKKSWFRSFFFTLPFYHKNRSPFAVASYYTQMFLSFAAPIIVFRTLSLLLLEGSYLTALGYFSGLLFIDLLFAIEYRLRNPQMGSKWAYRLLMPFLTVTLLDWMIYYSILTIRNNSWLTRAAKAEQKRSEAVAA